MEAYSPLGVVVSSLVNTYETHPSPRITDHCNAITATHPSYVAELSLKLSMPAVQLLTSLTPKLLELNHTKISRQRAEIIAT